MPRRWVKQAAIAAMGSGALQAFRSLQVATADAITAGAQVGDQHALMYGVYFFSRSGTADVDLSHGQWLQLPTGCGRPLVFSGGPERIEEDVQALKLLGQVNVTEAMQQTGDHR